jgi:septation ring formation regulator EzrA
MPDSLQQLAAINLRFAELTPGLAAATPEDCGTIAEAFDKITQLLEQARRLTASENADRDQAREVLAEYRHQLIAVRHAIARLEPLLTERRAQLRQEMEHVRNAGAWASSVREVR